MSKRRASTVLSAVPKAARITQTGKSESALVAKIKRSLEKSQEHKVYLNQSYGTISGGTGLNPYKDTYNLTYIPQGDDHRSRDGAKIKIKYVDVTLTGRNADAATADQLPKYVRIAVVGTPAQAYGTDLGSGELWYLNTRIFDEPFDTQKVTVFHDSLHMLKGVGDKGDGEDTGQGLVFKKRVNINRIMEYEQTSNYGKKMNLYLVVVAHRWDDGLIGNIVSYEVMTQTTFIDM